MREIVATRIISKVETDMRNYMELGRPLYRNKQIRSQIVKTDKTTWFRSEGATATLTVPVTKGSTLARRLRETVAQVKGPKGTSVKVLERPGLPLLTGLARSSPFPTKQCPRDKCPLEVTGSICWGKCSLENIVYYYR